MIECKHSIIAALIMATITTACGSAASKGGHDGGHQDKAPPMPPWAEGPVTDGNAGASLDPRLAQKRNNVGRDPKTSDLLADCPERRRYEIVWGCHVLQQGADAGCVWAIEPYEGYEYLVCNCQKVTGGWIGTHCHN